MIGSMKKFNFDLGFDSEVRKEIFGVLPDFFSEIQKIVDVGLMKQKAEESGALDFIASMEFLTNVLRDLKNSNMKSMTVFLQMKDFCIAANLKMDLVKILEEFIELD